jgi:hypothetical protein
VSEERLKWENIEHPTTNNQHPMDDMAAIYWLFDVGCWMFDVFVFELPCHPLHPSRPTPDARPENPAW